MKHRAETARGDALSRRLANVVPPNPDGTEGDVQRDRYTLTRKGLMALFPRGECGHIICLPLDACCLIRAAGDPGPGQPHARRHG